MSRRYSIWLVSRTTGARLVTVHSTHTRRAATRWIAHRSHLQPYDYERITR